MAPVNIADLDRYARQVRTATRMIVRRHRAAIERVSKLLLAQGSATADEVEHEINAARAEAGSAIPPGEVSRHAD